MTISTEWIRRVFLSATVTVVVAVVVALLSSCSVYKSNGRKTFEERAPDNLESTLVGQSRQSLQGDTCWTQPAKEPLWDLPEQGELRAHLISEETIEVCLVPAE